MSILNSTEIFQTMTDDAEIESFEKVTYANTQLTEVTAQLSNGLRATFNDELEDEGIIFWIATDERGNDVATSEIGPDQFENNVRGILFNLDGI